MKVRGKLENYLHVLLDSKAGQSKSSWPLFYFHQVLLLRNTFIEFLKERQNFRPGF